MLPARSSSGFVLGFTGHTRARSSRAASVVPGLPRGELSSPSPQMLSSQGLLCGLSPSPAHPKSEMMNTVLYKAQRASIGHLGPRPEGGWPLLIDPNTLMVTGLVCPGRTETSRPSLPLAHVGRAQPHLRPSQGCAAHPAPRLDPTAALMSVPSVALGSPEADPKIPEICQDLFPGNPAEALPGTV